VIDIGEKPGFLRFDEQGEVIGPLPAVISTQVPFLFDTLLDPDRSTPIMPVLSAAARQVETLAMAPVASVISHALEELHVVPVIAAEKWNLLK
jgi:hypothetical protein